MDSFPSTIDHLATIVGPLAALVFVVGCIVYLFNLLRTRKTATKKDQLKLFLWILPGAILVGIDFWMISFLQSQGLTEIRTFLASQEIKKVIRDGKPMVDGTKFLDDLKQMGSIPAHHTHPLRRIRIMLIGSNKNCALEVAQDSGDFEEYWVFYPKYRVTSIADIGRIKTTTLDSLTALEHQYK